METASIHTCCFLLLVWPEVPNFVAYFTSFGIQSYSVGILNILRGVWPLALVLCQPCSFVLAMLLVDGAFLLANN